MAVFNPAYGVGGIVLSGGNKCRFTSVCLFPVEATQACLRKPGKQGQRQRVFWCEIYAELALFVFGRAKDG